MGFDVTVWAMLTFPSEAALAQWRRAILDGARHRDWPEVFRGQLPRVVVSDAIDAWSGSSPTWLEVTTEGARWELEAVFDGEQMGTLGWEMACALRLAADVGARGSGLFDGDALLAVRVENGLSTVGAATEAELGAGRLGEVRSSAEMAQEAELPEDAAAALDAFERSVTRSMWTEEHLARAAEATPGRPSAADFSLPPPDKWLAAPEELFEATASSFNHEKLRQKRGVGAARRAMKQARAIVPPDPRWGARARDVLLLEQDDHKRAWSLAKEAGPLMFHADDRALLVDLGRLLEGPHPAPLYGIAMCGFWGGRDELDRAMRYCEGLPKVLASSFEGHLSDAIVRIAVRDRTAVVSLISARLRETDVHPGLRYGYEVALESIAAGTVLRRGAPALWDD